MKNRNAYVTTKDLQCDPCVKELICDIVKDCSDPVVGPTGPQGLPGLQGVPGNTGAAGANGLDGINGTDGAQGPQGIAGIDGAQGIQGIPGLNGVDGAVGPQGDPATNINTVIANNNVSPIRSSIGTYTNEANITFEIEESVTNLETPILTGNILTIPYVNELGVTQTVSVNLSGLVTTDINIDSAIYNASTNIITLTETDGSLHIIDLSEFSIIATTNVDGSINVVQEGVTKFTIPAPLPTQTASNEPFTPILASITSTGITSTNTQDAVAELDSEIKALQDKNRPWAKTGDLQDTNNEDVLVTDNILHEGRVNIGASEIIMPFDLIYKEKTFGNSKVIGHQVRNESFDLFHLRSKLLANRVAKVTLDLVNGTDGLEPTEYLGGLVAFKTFRPCFDWINQINNTVIDLTILNATSANPLLFNGSVTLYGKTDVRILGEANIGTYMTFSGASRITSINSNVTFYNINFTAPVSDILYATSRGSMQFSQCIFNLSPTANSLFAFSQSQSVWFSESNTINFSANNQVLIHPTGNAGANIYFTNDASNFTINAGSLTGIRWTDGNHESVNTYFAPDNILNIVNIPSNVDMSNTILHYGASQSLRTKVFNRNLTGYAQNLGTTKPLRFTDLDSTSPDGAFVTRKQLFINELGEIIVG